MVICAVRARNSALVMVEPSIETNRRLGGLATALALADGGIEPVKDFAGEQAAQLAAIALGERRHDHFVGGRARR